MFNHFLNPWFLLLLILFFISLMFRKSGYFLRHAHLPILAKVGKKNMGRNMLNILPNLLKLLSGLLLILAAADYYKGYYQPYKKSIIHNYILLNDGSGSMTVEGQEKGVGPKLKSLLAGNDYFLTKLEKLERPDGSKDLVAAAVFSNDAFVLSYAVEDYDFIRQKLNEIDWRLSPLNLGTEVDKAIWLGIQMLFKQGGVNNIFSEEELFELETNLRGHSRELNLSNLSFLDSKKIKEQIRGSSLIVFTDGQISFDGHRFRMSVAKLLLFCKELGIRVYLISVEQISADLMKYIKETGGDGLIMNDFSSEKINKAYEEIINREAGEYIIVDQAQKRHYGDYFAGLGLTLLIVYIVLRNTMSRSLTEI